MHSTLCSNQNIAKRSRIGDFIHVHSQAYQILAAPTLSSYECIVKPQRVGSKIQRKYLFPLCYTISHQYVLLLILIAFQFSHGEQ